MRRQNGFRGVLAVGEFRALWGAEVVSVCGDQLARVGLAVLVFRQTSSAALTALTYALTFVPAVVGGVVLAGLGDRFPRRTVLVVCDLVRAGLAGLMALPVLPLLVLWVLVFGLALAAAPFKAAQLALLPEVLDGERYPVGLAVRTVSSQVAQLVGFVGGGSVLLVVSPQAVLGVNALTFVWSAVIVRVGVAARPAAAGGPRGEAGRRRGLGGVLAGDRRVLVLVGLIASVGLTVAPEGVAAPYAAGLGGSALAVGLLLAADPAGSAIGAWLVGRWGSPSARAVVPLAVVSGLALVPCALRPGLVASMVLWAVCGACSAAVLIQAQTLLTQAVPNSRRAAVTGLASGCLQATQGAAVLAAGVLAQHSDVYWAVGVVGAITAGAAVMLGLLWHRAGTEASGEHDAEERSDVAVTGHGFSSGHLPSDQPTRKVGTP